MAMLKVIEVMASSTHSFEDTIRNAVKQAGGKWEIIRSAYV
jgi:flavin-binding protein dodecin